ncbi:MAG: hypothetical protein ACI9QC_000414 [Oceanicoccus sp.]|jgi:hypothetical protein
MPLFSKDNQNSPIASALSVKIGYILGGFLGFLLLFQMVQFYQLRDKLQFIDGLQESQSTVVEQVSLSQNYLSQFATDLNQIREFLLLPESDYDFSELGELSTEEVELDLTTQLFELVEALGAAEKNEAAYNVRLVELQEYLSVSDSFIDKGVSVDPLGVEGLDGVTWTIVDDSNGVKVLAIALAYDAGLTLTSYIDGDSSFSSDAVFLEISEKINSYMLGLDIFRATIAAHDEGVGFLEGTLFPSEPFQTYLNANLLSLNTREENDTSSSYSLMNSDGILLASFQVWKREIEDGITLIIPAPIDGFSEEKWIDISPDQLGQDLVLSALESLVDTRTALDLKVEERRTELFQVMEDRGFVGTLEALGLTMGELVEEEVRLYYSIVSIEGEILRNLVLDFATGEVRVEMPDTGVSESLDLATANLRDTAKKKLSTYLA